MNSLQTLLLVAAAAAPQAAALSTAAPTKDRPLLRQFGKSINERVVSSKSGHNSFGLGDHYTSAETIPCLDMQTDGSGGCSGNSRPASSFDVSTRRDVREAYQANDNTQQGTQAAVDGVHGRSSGSGCCIIRLQGEDAASVRGLVDFADNFFDGVDGDGNDAASNIAARSLKDLGVFRIANNVHAGFDHNVNEEDKMQVLYTKLIPGQTNDEDPLLLPLEVGELVGAQSLSRAHSGMGTLFDIGSQITSAVLGMESESTNKLLDDCSRLTETTNHAMTPENHEKIADTMSNSYQRIIRYLKPKPASSSSNEGAEDDAAFWPHVDSTFLTLIPMPEIAGLEVWCPSSRYAESDDLAERGEWVRPIKPSVDDTNTGDAGETTNDDDYIHVVALAGEFLQLLSDGQVPTCIHRVIAPQPPSLPAFGVAPTKYKPRVSAPLFLRPRRGAGAVLEVESDLRDSDATGLYFEEGLLDECDGNASVELHGLHEPG
ncbi:hypothetical protein ACHAXT_002834 [Thalassiosira profunda]